MRLSFFRGMLALTAFSFVLGRAGSASASDYILSNTDFDGDAKSDVVLFDSEKGTYAIKRSTTGLLDQITLLGQSGTLPISGDYDSDGISDLGYFNARASTWTIRRSSDSSTVSLVFGLPGEIAVPARYHGNPCTDIATYDRRSARWTIANCTSAGTTTFELGVPGDLPVPADYDGDGRDDPAAFRNGRWSLLLSGSGAQETRYFGLPGDVPVPANFYGSSSANLAVFRPATGQFFVRATDGSVAEQASFGLPGDQPLTLHADGNTAADLYVYRPLNRTAYSLTTPLDSLDRVYGEYTFPVQQQSGSGMMLKSSAFFLDPEFCSLYPEICEFCNIYPYYCFDDDGGDFDGGDDEDIDYPEPPGVPGVPDGNPDGGGSGGGFFPPSKPSLPAPAVTQLVAGYGTHKRSVPGDFNGDGRADIALVGIAPSNIALEWQILDPNTGTLHKFEFGLAGDTVLAGPSYYGGRWVPTLVRTDNETNLLRWYTVRPDGSVEVEEFGLAGDTVFFADVEGDGAADKIVTRPGAAGDLFRYWYIKLSSTGGVVGAIFGFGSDEPYVSDLLGYGHAAIGVVREEVDGGRYWYTQDVKVIQETGQLNPDPMLFGLAADYDSTLVGGDFDGDGKADHSIVRNVGGGLNYFSRGQDGLVLAVPFGLSGDRAFYGDFSGIGRDERGVYRPSTNTIYLQRSSGMVQTIAVPSNARRIILGDGRGVNLDPAKDNLKFQCDLESNMKDGKGKGKLWKPEREGGFSSGDATILLPAENYSSFKVDKIKIYGATGEQVGHAKLRYDYGHGGRSVWDVQQDNSELAPHGPLVVQVNFHSGLTECLLGVASPYNRYD